jgi:prolipoprotein diacylglyceryltransferase
MFGLILFLDRRRPFKGYTFWLAMMSYSVWRFFIDFIRYYEDSMIIFSTGDYNITRNQFLTVCLFIIALAWFIYLRRKNERIDKKPDRESELSA